MRQLSFVLPSLKMDMLLNPEHYQVYSFKWPISNIVNCTNKELLHFAWNIKAKELHFPSLRAFFVSFCFLVIWLFVFITDSEHCKMHQSHKLEIRWLTEVPNVQRQSWPTSFLPWLWNIHRSETNWLDWDNQAVSQLRPKDSAMNNGEQVTETGQTALQLPALFPTGNGTTRPYWGWTHVKGVVEVRHTPWLTWIKRKFTFHSWVQWLRCKNDSPLWEVNCNFKLIGFERLHPPPTLTIRVMSTSLPELKMIANTTGYVPRLYSQSQLNLFPEASAGQTYRKNCWKRNSKGNKQAQVNVGHWSEKTR